MTDIKELAEQWIALDKNETTRNEIASLLVSNNTDELERRLRNRIEFGTAGLRGRMQAGFAYMNDLTIIQASQGLASYIHRTLGPGALKRGVVVGHDHRYNSERWARLTAGAFLREGFVVWLMRGLVHTPTVPFAVKRLGAAGGVMITASHNPKQDNGYKVYWENAVQIIEPHDKSIASSILTASLTPPPSSAWDADTVEGHERCKDCTADVRESYIASLKSLLVSPPPPPDPTLKLINTSMHGVSHSILSSVFSTLSLPAFVPVEEQKEPDPEFRTVGFPNPEESGALDLAMRTAEREGAEYVLAQDPDADRFAAAERQSDGSWIQFTGDQLGTLFGEATMRRYRDGGKPLDKVAMVASTVSSKMLEAIARKEGFRFKDCLTGFKYIGNTALDLVEEGYDVPFGYEEAIGFMFGDGVRDKDGVAATVVFTQLILTLRAQGNSVNTHLQELYERYGHFRTSNSYFVCGEQETIDRIFGRLRGWDGAPRTYPTSIAGLTVTSIVDLTTGYDSSNPPTYKPALPLSSGHMVQIRAKGERTGIVLTIRTSGTEPKIKYYLEGSGSDPKAVDEDLEVVVKELGEVWLEAGRWGLKKAGEK